VLADAYRTMTSHLHEATEYVNQWLSYQSLWDVSMESITSLLSGDISKWQQVSAHVLR
jgi:hypothetical protein